MTISTFTALLRGINVGRSARIGMADLRDLCSEIGWSDVRTYIQSGNVIFRTAGTAGVAELESRLEEALHRRFGRAVPVIVRRASDWPAYVRGNPFPDASERTPGLVMIALSRAAPRPDAVERLRERAMSEQIARVDDALWIHYPEGSGRSKLTPALLDRAVGSPTTTRNWRTVMKLNELASGQHEPPGPTAPAGRSPC